MQLIEYLNCSGKGAVTALANAIDAPIPDVSRWASGKRPIPPGRCVEIEKATNKKVKRQDLRPNDWAEIWQELSHD